MTAHLLYKSLTPRNVKFQLTYSSRATRLRLTVRLRLIRYSPVAFTCSLQLVYCTYVRTYMARSIFPPVPTLSLPLAWAAKRTACCTCALTSRWPSRSSPARQAVPPPPCAPADPCMARSLLLNASRPQRQRHRDGPRPLPCLPSSRAASYPSLPPPGARVFREVRRCAAEITAALDAIQVRALAGAIAHLQLIYSSPCALKACISCP